MTQDEKTNFYRLVTDALSYYKQDVSSFILGVWWEGCKGFSMDQVVSAFSRHATDPEKGEFAPKVANIVKLLQGTPTDRAQVAWGKVLEAIQRVGPYCDVVFDDAAIHAAIVDLGGWTKLCAVTYEELSYLQHRFCESHKAYVRCENFDYPRMLSGIRSPDHEYANRGLPPPKPQVIGDVPAARLVYKRGQQGGKMASLLLAAQAKLLITTNGEEQPPSDSRPPSREPDRLAHDTGH